MSLTKLKTILFILVLLLGANPSFAHVRGQEIAVAPSEVAPTQAVIGYRWALTKVERFSRMSKRELDETLKDDPAPAVLGPDGRFYILDNHHEFFALIELGVSRAYIRVVEDYSKRSFADFYRLMLEKNWLYLGDDKGDLSYTPESMPKYVAQLGDDVYRSIAGFVRKMGGFKKDKSPHSEFRWAARFRKIITLRAALADFDASIAIAFRFAKGISDCEDELLP